MNHIFKLNTNNVKILQSWRNLYRLKDELIRQEKIYLKKLYAGLWLDFCS